MQTSVVKVPFGPEFTLYGEEFYAVTRHRFLLFFYFGIACLILACSMGSKRNFVEPELVLGLAALEVLVGILVLLLGKRILAWRALRAGTVPYVHLGWALIAIVGTSVTSGEVLRPLLFGTPRSGALEYVLMLVFYITTIELLTSIVLQYAFPYIIADLRKDSLRTDSLRKDSAPAVDAAMPPRDFVA